MAMSKEDLQGAVSIASRYAPGAAAPKSKTLMQEMARRRKLRRKKKEDDKRYRQIMASKGRSAGSQYSANADEVYRNVKAGKYD